MTDEEKLEQLVRNAGKRTPLPDDVRARFESVFRKQLDVTRARRRRTRMQAIFGVAASLLLALVFVIVQTPSRSSEVVAQVEGSEGQAFWQYQEERGPLRSGNEIQTHDIISTTEGLLSIKPAKSNVDVRLARMTEIEFMDDGSLRLNKGAVYVDAGAAGSADDKQTFTIWVNGVRIDHVGTQYLVTSDQNGISVAVREGEVIIKSSTDEFRSRVANGSGQLVELGRDDQFSSKVIATYGERWAWTNKMAPDIETGEMLIDDFLHWVSRETGYSLAYASPVIQQVAQSNRLVGPIPTSDVIKALELAMSTTPYTASVTDGVITITD